MVFNFGLSAASCSERAALWKSKHIHHRLGRRFMALDYGGNVIFYRGFRENHIGGWAPLTVLDPSPLSVDPHHPTGRATLVSNFPMHARCGAISESVVEMLTKHKRYLEIEFARTLKEKHVTILKEMAEEEKPPNKDGQPQPPASSEEAALEVDESTPKAPVSRHPATPQDPPPSTLNFSRQLGLKAHKDGLNPEHFILKDEFVRALGRKHLFRLNRFVTWTYKAVYYLVWAALGVMGVVAYTRFKYWLNPPARQGLEKIEEEWLKYPRDAGRWIVDNVCSPATDTLDDFLYAEEIFGSESTVIDEYAPAVATALRGILRPSVESLRDAAERVTSVAMQRAYMERQREREAAETAVSEQFHGRRMRTQVLIAVLLALLGLLLT